MTKVYILPIHSFVDLITNSSSEIFVGADESTLKAVKEIIRGILKSAGSEKTLEDLFVVKLMIEDDEEYNEDGTVYMDEAIKKECPDTDDDMYDITSARGKRLAKTESESQRRREVRVTAVNSEDAAAKKVAKILSDLPSCIVAEERYNG